MSETVIKVENLYKEYRLGVIGYGSLHEDLKSWWARVRGKEDPNSVIGSHHSKEAEKSHFLALNDVSFEVKQGEVLGIIGKNGAGKSTLLKILSRITAPTKGTIKIKGRIGSLLEVGTGFHPELTGRENIYLNGAILGMRKKEITKKLDEIITFSGVEKFIDTPVKRYSSGMYVRLAFSVAAHLETEILVVDEVLAVGDIEFQKKCLGKMSDVSTKEGRTVLFVSHNMGSVRNLCSRGMLLESGKCVKIGDTEEVISEYMYNTKKLYNMDISKRTDRKGNGTVKFVNYYFTDKNGKKVESLITGQDYIMNIIIDVKSSNNNIIVSVGINNSAMERITLLSNDMTGEVLKNVKKGENIIKIYIKKLSLSIGQYSFTLFMKNESGICDWIINAGFFNVEIGDYFKTGKLLPLNQGIFFINHKFEI